MLLLLPAPLRVLLTLTKKLLLEPLQVNLLALVLVSLLRLGLLQPLL